MIKIKKQFLIRVLYKSGNSVDFWATEYTYTPSTTEHSWKASFMKPIKFGADAVEAVWQIKWRYIIVWE